MADKNRVPPCACFSHDEERGRLRIDLEMPGANKDDIKLEMRKDSFCVSAPIYSSCFMLPHEIEPEKTGAEGASPNLLPATL